MSASTTRSVCVAIATLLLCCEPVSGQQATRVQAVTQPGRGEVDATQLISFDRYGRDPTGAGRTVTDLSVHTVLRYGISRDWSAVAQLPIVSRVTEMPAVGPGDDEEGIQGLGDARVDLRYRFYQHDFGPLNTIRLAARFGVEAPTGARDVGSHSWDPIIGASAMYINGRWGLNASAEYKLSTSTIRDNAIIGSGADDLLEFGTAAVYRVFPERWGNESHGAGYIVLEHVSRFETGGDREVVAYPGLLWEDTRWAAELSVGVPIHQRSVDRLERDFSLSIGFRVLF
ncbi:MAG: hypothetical protein AAGB51_09900 [Planctomycetota bacterium]